jgi:hypothetical protein
MADRFADVEPPELVAVLDLAERARIGDWSLRSALTRYAQPEPLQVGELLDLYRRIEVVLPGLIDVATKHGPALWSAATADGGPNDDIPPFAIGLLQAMIEIDGLGERLAAWADNWTPEHPKSEVAAVIADVRKRLEDLGVPEQERPGPPRGRAGRG